MGQTMIALGRLEEAEALFQSALEKAAARDDQETQVHAHARLGALYIQTGQLVDANRHIHEAESMARRMSYYRGLAEALAAGGELAARPERFHPRPYLLQRSTPALYHAPQPARR